MAPNGKKVLILAADLYEEMELWYPYFRLREDGVEVVLGGTEGKTVKGKHGYPATVDRPVEECRAAEFDGCIVPGGYAPDRMRRNPRAVEILREIGEAGKPVGSICHGPWMLISAGLVRGRTVTGFVAIRDDLVNAGATYVDREVVRDGNIVTSRTPQDLPVFMKEYLRALSEA